MAFLSLSEFCVSLLSVKRSGSGIAKKSFSRVSQEQYHLDHIVPLSLICSRNSKNFSLFLQSPVGQILESSINKQYLKASDNLKKSDKIYLSSSSFIKASSFRNHYGMIVRVLRYHLGYALGVNFDYEGLIERHKLYCDRFGL